MNEYDMIFEQELDTPSGWKTNNVLIKNEQGKIIEMDNSEEKEE